jgi:peptidoglycan/xylan/chitin deacetylase (PgdA/CDA1 family)
VEAARTERQCALSVDLDPVVLYHRIHGLESPDPDAANALLDLALDRFLEFSAELGALLTLFVVARELERPSFAERLRRALTLGHEIGNHTLDHPYDLVRRSRAEQREQVAGAADAIERTLGVRPRGFRAPGYLMTDELLAVVKESGHVYDSSVFPSPPYFAAKLAAHAALALRGRRSESILAGPEMLRAPTQPYRVGRRYFERGAGHLVELPIQVTRGARLPFIGTALTMSGELGARALTRMVAGEPFVNLEFHAIDLLERADGLEALRGYQPDLGVGVGRKRRIYRTAVENLGRRGYRFVRLEEAARAAEPVSRAMA